MRIRDEEVAVRVPATSANLGPGFDSLGMALSHWDEISVRATVGATHVTIDGYGAGVVDTGEDNLVVRALRLGLDQAGASQVGLEMYAKNRIPHSRGLGSSAAAIVAGLTLARALIGDAACLTAPDLLQLATDMEGHPDNIAPALLGGATIAWVNDGYASAVQLGCPQGIHPTVFVPDYEVSTSAARQALPTHVAHSDASINAGRAALLAAILTGASGRGVSAQQRSGRLDVRGFLMDATADLLHQEYRRPVMEPSMMLVDWLRQAGYPAVISGAGPTVLSFEEISADIRAQATAAGWTVMNLALAPHGVEITQGRLTGSGL